MHILQLRLIAMFTMVLLFGCALPVFAGGEIGFDLQS